MVSIRTARIDDAAALLAVYRPWVEASTVSFESKAPTVAEFAARIERSLSAWTWLVAEIDGECVGYAYGGSHRERAGYRWSVETSAYLRADQHRRGLGAALYTCLLDELAALGYCNAYAGVTLPNDASLALHRRLGFTDIGRFARIGWKFGAWHDVAWLQRPLREGPAGPPASG
jgi:phosphinothricin acetyltransferase